MNSLAAGPELDRLIAERVMGWKYDPEFGLLNGEQFMEINGSWSPSTNIAHAWEVMEQLRHKAIYLDVIQTDNGFMVGDGSDNYTNDDGHIEGTLYYVGLADTAPHAICLAALRASGLPNSHLISTKKRFR
jgi:hypothetical protein